METRPHKWMGLHCCAKHTSLAQKSMACFFLSLLWISTYKNDSLFMLIFEMLVYTVFTWIILWGIILEPLCPGNYSRQGIIPGNKISEKLTLEVLIWPGNYASEGIIQGTTVYCHWTKYYRNLNNLTNELLIYMVSILLW